MPVHNRIDLSHQSENHGIIREFSLGCMKGVVLCMKKLHFICCILFAGTGVRKISTVACGFRPFRIHHKLWISNQQHVAKTNCKPNIALSIVQSKMFLASGNSILLLCSRSLTTLCDREWSSNRPLPLQCMTSFM